MPLSISRLTLQQLQRRAEDQVQPNGAHEVVREWAVDRQHLAAFEDMNARGKRALQALGM